MPLPQRTEPLSLRGIPSAMAALIARYGRQIQPGDIDTLNDPVTDLKSSELDSGVQISH
jgi:hypothetical protein